MGALWEALILAYCVHGICVHPWLLVSGAGCERRQRRSSVVFRWSIMGSVTWE